MRKPLPTPSSLSLSLSSEEKEDYRNCSRYCQAVHIYIYVWLTIAFAGLLGESEVAPRVRELLGLL